jgi:cob(I)alamin adenosyltransferase
MSIYTRTGDTGSTSLFGGERVLKCHELVEVYGSIDELNSWIGYLRTVIQITEITDCLQNVQSDLFTIGGYLAGWKTVDLSGLIARIKTMETMIDAMDTELSVLSNFILPGGAETASQVHIARSICRRVERQTVALRLQDVDEIIAYFNRLSDLLFTIARYINKKEGIQEIVWIGIDRESKKK